MLLLEGGRVVCPASGVDAPMDVLVEGDVITAVGQGLGDLERAEGARVIDCKGMVVGPGLVDLSAELCDPGFTWREDLESGSEAAAAGGFTTVLASPRTDPVVDNASVLTDVLSRATLLSGARVLQAGALTAGLKGQELAELGLMWDEGVVAFSDGAVPVEDAGVLRRALEYTRPFGVPVLLRPAEPDLEREGVMHEGAVSLRIGLRGIPAAAEEIGVARIISLVRLSGARVHLTHVTTARAAELVVRARDEGLPITASVPARNLVLTDEAVENTVYGPDTRVDPPLRPEADRRALVEAVRRGSIDAVISAHVPWTRVEKELEFAYAKPGAVGLETALRCVLTAFEGDARAALQALAVRPSQVLGRTPRVAEGEPADLVVFEPRVACEVAGDLRSRGCNDPFRGRELRGHVCTTVVGGRVVFGPIPS